MNCDFSNENKDFMKIGILPKAQANHKPKLETICFQLKYMVDIENLFDTIST